MKLACEIAFAVYLPISIIGCIYEMRRKED